MLLWYLYDLYHGEIEYRLFFVLVLITAGAVLMALTLHELSHGLVAYRLGDPTAKNMGRLSLNPLRHLDPAGTAMFLLVGFGWAKPVPVNPYLLRTEPRRGMAMVGLAGPFSNLAIAAIFSLSFRLTSLEWHALHATPPSDWGLQWAGIHLIESIISLNLLLAVFNLIPIPPLDGFRIAVGILPRRWAIPFAEMERYGLAFLLILVAVSFYTGILWDIISAGGNFFSDIFLGARIFHD